MLEDRIYFMYFPLKLQVGELVVHPILCCNSPILQPMLQIKELNHTFGAVLVTAHQDSIDDGHEMSSKISILYADDEETLRLLVPNQLSLEGFSVDVADDGDTAVKMLKKKSYDILLLDIRMPRMNGIEVLNHMKENRISCRVIMLTGVDDLTVALEAVKSGAKDYLTKPYEIRTLLGCIKRVMAE